MSSEPDSRQASDERPAEINPGVNYEPQDVDPGSIFKFLVGLVLTVLFTMAVVSYVYSKLAARETPSAAAPSPLRDQREQIWPPEPRLQGAPGHDKLTPQEELRQSRAEAEAALRSYAWVDEKAGTARIPIEEAMRLVAQRGLPASAAAKAVAAKKEKEKRP